MAYGFVLIVGLLGIVVYLTLMFSAIPGAVDERLGALEPLPENLGQWTNDDSSDDAKAAARDGLTREVRHLHQPRSGLFGREYITRQVRYRDATGRITRVDPEEKHPRRRIKTEAS